MDTDSTPWGWIMGAGASIGAVLSGAVANLYRNQIKIYEARIVQLESDVAKLDQAFEACQREHSQTQIQLAIFGEKLHSLEIRDGPPPPTNL